VHIFLPQNAAFNTHLSHQKMRQNSRTAVWVLKIPGHTPLGPPMGESWVGGWGKWGWGRKGVGQDQGSGER